MIKYLRPCDLLSVLLILLIGTSFTLPVQAQVPYVSKAWVADQGNGTYKNPILHADYSDPDVVRVGDDFYMTASSFNCVPGLPVLHSKDLVNWKIVNYALPELRMEGVTPENFFDLSQHGRGVWAPCIRYHNGEYMIYWGDPDFGIYVVKTKDILGKWDEPILVLPGKGRIDPSPLFDDDGSVYLVHAWAGSRAGFNSVLTMAEMNAEGTKLIRPEVIVFNGFEGGDNNHTVEGPKCYKRNGYYYIFAPAGGVLSGWQLALRSKSVYGPYEFKKVLHQGSSPVNGPHQGGWVTTPDGKEDWFVHFQDNGCYGRIIHLQPMKWVNDWPVIGVDKEGKGIGEPVLTYKKPNVGKTYFIETPAESDEFDDMELGKQWEWHGNPEDTWAFFSNQGYIRLYPGYLPKGYVNMFSLPNLLMQKFPAELFSASLKLTFNPYVENERAGLVVMGWDYATLTLVKKGEELYLEQEISLNNDREPVDKTTFSIPYCKIEQLPYHTKTESIYLKVQVKAEGMCAFSYSKDGKNYKSVGEPFKARQGKWIGAKVGLFAVVPHEAEKVSRGHADFDWFRIEK